MLRDVLARDRLFAVARLDPALAAKPGAVEPANPVACVGIIRACQKADSDTSNLLLQGICRVEIRSVVREHPYRLVAVRPLTTTAGGSHAQLEVERLEVMRLLSLRRRLGTPAPKGMTQFSRASRTSTPSPTSPRSTSARVAPLNKNCSRNSTPAALQLFATQLKGEIEAQKLRRKLQGHLPDDHIVDN